MKLITLTTALILINSPVMAKEKLTSAEAVDYCVNEVHQHKVTDNYEQQFYREFDAYFNPATGLVYNNARRNGDEQPKFLFNKCMTKIGFPLG